ncbi:unnamed protein product [Ceratitis capitata]|uniref:(Mediterranean fruit fly) hypothetical protein n=1 Tax=Ceratitis capitata TaxID=7213 RepID=A0A811V0M3_CERCA|nr:unnamed protein product [Ceratitis capitata]
MFRSPFIEIELSYGGSLKPSPEGENETSTRIRTARVICLHRFVVNSPEVDIFYNFTSWQLIDGKCTSFYFFCPCDCGLLVEDVMTLHRPTSVQIKTTNLLPAGDIPRDLVELELELSQRIRKAQAYVSGLSMEEARQLDASSHLLRAVHIPAIGQMAAEHNQQLPRTIFLNYSCDLPNHVIPIIDALEIPPITDVARLQLSLQDDEISSSSDVVETHLRGHRAQRLIHKRIIVQSEMVTTTTTIEECDVGEVDDAEDGEDSGDEEYEEDEEDGDDADDGPQEQ